VTQPPSATEPAVLPYGAWPSPISAADLAGPTGPPQWPAFVDDHLWWTEVRPDDHARMAIVRAVAPGAEGITGAVQDVLPAPFSARTRVHEYGGRSWLVLHPGTGPVLIFAENADQRLYALEPGQAVSAPRPLTPKPQPGQDLRYADPVAGPDGTTVWCVREAHTAAGIRRHLVEVRLTGEVVELVGGSDFFAFPRPAPDGRSLAWIAWDHPAMPWTDTVLRIAEIAADGTIGAARDVLGGPGVSVLQPEWAPDGTLYALTDETGFWNLVEVDPSGVRPPRPLCPRAEEFGGPLWNLGFGWYAVLDDGRIVCEHGTDTWTLSLLDPATGVLTDLGADRTAWRSELATDGRLVADIAGSPDAAWALAVVDPTGSTTTATRTTATRTTATTTTSRPAAGPEVDPALLPEPYAVALPSVAGRTVHANVYPPRNPAAVGPAGELPPYVVIVHGGPTSQSPMVRSLATAYWTSRGLGVLDVNYGGSSGYGRAYRDTLDEAWGLVDVEDTAAAARALADTGVADGARLVIRGGSAGGWTVLSALTRTDTFAAGASYYGVAELERFAEDTHDFESRYLDHLIGALPEHRDRYVAWAPITNVDGLSCPVLLLQGAEDKVVPPSQAELFRDALAAKGIPHAYLLFEGEAHGFRRTETVVTATEAELSFYGQVLGFTPPGIPVLPLTTS
jgi:dipeptidyl aminopeptidase/acylaminoacyl peptidase